MKNFLTLGAVAASYSFVAIAQTERDLDSHVHGSAAMNVAIAESSVFIELNTPWDNLVGFEHAPKTDEQHALVDTALQQLDDPDQLFSFDGGGCNIDDVMIENTMSAGDSHDEDHDDEHNDEHNDDEDHDKDAEEGHKDEHSDDHDKEHADEGHEDEHSDEHDKEHAEEHAAEDGESETHTTVLVTYSYSCDQIAKLKTIDLSLFAVWPGFDELDVQLIGEKGQTLVELNAENTMLNLDLVH